MENLWIYLGFALGVLIIVKGGDYFVDAASWIAEVSGIPKFIVGATIVSMATTLPEIIVSSMAAYSGSVDMAIGNSVGSVIANTGLILAISIMFMPMAFKRSLLAFKGMHLIIVIIALWLLSLSGKLTTTSGLILLVLFIAFIVENVYSAKRTEGNIEEDRPSHSKRDITVNVLKFIVGALGIVIGSRLLVNNGCSIAELLGVPENIVGLTAVAIGTSLPELVTTINAIVRKEFSLSAGNIIGANIIDTALILPICAFISKGSIPVSAQNLRLDMPLSLILTIITIVPALIRGKFSRWQGVLALCIYLAYLVYICVLM